MEILDNLKYHTCLTKKTQTTQQNKQNLKKKNQNEKVLNFL